MVQAKTALTEEVTKK
jgi:hypothetical protein